MTRLAAIAAALLVLVGVLASASAYATPLAATPLPAGEVCAERVAPLAAGTLKVRICAKRHSLGLPCTPQPLTLPALAGPDFAAPPPAPTPPPASAPDGTGLADCLFRPPRALA